MDPLRDFQDTLIVRNVVARFVEAKEKPKKLVTVPNDVKAVFDDMQVKGGRKPAFKPKNDLGVIQHAIGYLHAHKQEEVAYGDRKALAKMADELEKAVRGSGDEVEVPEKVNAFLLKRNPYADKDEYLKLTGKKAKAIVENLRKEIKRRDVVDDAEDKLIAIRRTMEGGGELSDYKKLDW